MKQSFLLPTPFREERRILKQSIEGLPAFLYKYMAVEEDRLRTLLIDSALYLPSRTQFNDPFDVTCSFEFTKNEKVIAGLVRDAMKLQKIPFNRLIEVKRNIRNNLHSAEALRSAFSQVADSVGIVSLAPSPRSLLMWAHYARNHTGVCLQFYPPADRNVFAAVFRVRYSDKKIVLDLGKNFDEESVFEIILQKSNEWSYEKEWRIVASRLARTFGPFQSGALVSVIYGAKCSPANVKVVKALLEERAKLGMPRVAELRASLSPAHYGLGIFSAASEGEPKNWVGRPSLLMVPPAPD